MAYIFDCDTNVISLTSGTTSVDLKDLYSRWKDWVSTSGFFCEQAISTVGGETIDPIQGIYVTSYFFLENGWKIKPQEASHKLIVSNGVLTTSDGSDPFISTSGNFNVMIQYSQPIKTETVATGGGSSPSGAVEVSSLQAGALTQIVSAGNGAGWANVNDLSSITNAINSITNTLATLKVTVSGMTPYALTQIVGAGNAAGWSVNGGSFTLGASSGLNIDFQLSKNYIPVSGATVNILIKRDTDNYYYNGSGWINTVPTPTLVTTEYDASRFPGLYRYTLSPNFAGNIFASVNYTESGIVYSENGVWTIVEDDSAEMASNIITIGNDVSGLISTTSNIDTNVSGLITTTNSIKTKIDRININSSGNLNVSVSGVVIPTSKFTKIRYV